MVTVADFILGGSRITADGDCSQEIKRCLLLGRKAIINLLLLLLLSLFVVSNSVWPHRQQPTRLPSPWDSPGKNTGVGCHFLLQRMKVKSESDVTQLCLTLSDPMDCSPPVFSIHGIFQARVNQLRQHIKKQRHYFANKGPSSRGYGFSSSHVWMWDLDY